MDKDYNFFEVLVNCYEDLLEEYSHIEWFHLSWEEKNSDELSKEEKDTLEKTRRIEIENFISNIRNKDMIYKDTNAFGQEIIYKRCPICGHRDFIAVQNEDKSFEF